jgi:hypothetical protein
MGRTSIQVSDELADELHGRKDRGDSYEDVIWRLIDRAEADEGQPSGSGRFEPVDNTEAVDDAHDGVSDDTGGPREIDPAVSDAGVDAVSDLQAAIDDIDLPGSGAKLEDRRDAVRACLAYLAEHGDATPSEFREHVYPNHPGGYTQGDDPPRSWWKNCVYKGLRQLAGDDDRLQKADTTGVWSLNA